MSQIGFPSIPGCGYYGCDFCQMPADRVFTDSWTGKDMCLDCAHQAAYRTTSSPHEESDNLVQVLSDRVPEPL